MIKVKQCLLICIAVLFVTAIDAQVTFQTRQFRMALDKTGRLTALSAVASGKNYLPETEKAYLLSVKLNNKIVEPNALLWKAKSSELILSYPGGDLKATIKVLQQPAYISFELKQLTHASEVEWVLWGPFPTNIADTVGEVVGVVRNKDFAIGIQALNIKTLGGHPAVDSDIQPSYDIFAQGNKVDVLKDDINKQLFRGD